MSLSDLIAALFAQEESSRSAPTSRLQRTAADSGVRPKRLRHDAPTAIATWVHDAQVREEADAVEAELERYLAEVRRADAKRPAWTKRETVPARTRIRINLVVGR